jgi:hypothetical protein
MAQANELAVLASPQKPWVTSKVAADAGAEQSAAAASRVRTSMDLATMNRRPGVVFLQQPAMRIQELITKSYANITRVTSANVA